MTAEPKVIALAEHQRAQRSDDDLMRLARAGAAGAFDTLVRRHQARVLRLCHRYLSDTSLTQDAAQNTFIELYRYLPRYEPKGQFDAFLRRVALNQCRMSARGKRRDPPPLPEPLPEDGPDVQVLAAERQREIARAMSKLSARHREVLALRFGADLGYQEIAETLRIPIGTVRSRLFEALKKLRRRLGGVR